MSNFRRIITGGIALLAVFVSGTLCSYSQAKNATANDGYAVPLPAQMDLKTTGLAPVGESVQAQGWKDFTQKNGQWQISVDKVTGAPRCAFGKPIAIAGYDHITGANVEEAALQFLSENQKLFCLDVNNIRMVRKDLVNGKWYLSFRQYYKGIEVLLSRIELRISEKGSVMAFDVEYFKNINISTEPTVSTAQAVSYAGGGISPKAKLDVTMAAGKTFILPVKKSGSVDYHLVYNVNVKPTDKYACYSTFVDAHNGDVVWRYNTVHQASEFYVEGSIKPKTPTDNEVVMPFAEMYVTVGGTQYTSDENGKVACNVSSSTQVQATFTGPWINVLGEQTTISSYNGPLVSGTVVFDDKNSHIYERNMFYHANYIHDFYKKLDPQMTCMDRQMAVILSYKYEQYYGGANAYSSRDTICFVNVQMSDSRLAGGPAVLFHEYGHSINTLFYEDKGIYEGMESSTLHEAIADMTAGFLLDEPRIGIGTTTKDPEDFIRNLKNTAIYPDSLVGEGHSDSRILSGAMWDLREMTSLDLVQKLSHFARYGLPDDENTGVVFYKWLIETLIADDDDGDLTNGTPHSNEIKKAFDNHHIGTSLYFRNNFSHTPYEDTQSIASPYAIDFNFGQGVPILGYPDSAVVSYRIVKNGVPSPYYTVPATSQVNSLQYSSAIPQQDKFTIINYFIKVYTYGSTEPTVFGSGSENQPYMFMIGYNRAFYDSFEGEDNDWENGSDEDNASVGLWEKGEPFEIDLERMDRDIIKPGTNHTEGGNYLFSTGLTGVPEDKKNNLFYIFAYLIPDGITTLNSPVFDISKLNDIYFKYYLWFKQYIYYLQDADFVPKLETQLSNDGGNTWVTVYDDSSEGIAAWEKKIIHFTDYLPKTNQCMIRFKYHTMEGYMGFPAVLASASVDDFEILTADNKQDAEDDGSVLNPLPVWPNPFSNNVSISYTSDIDARSVLTISNLQGETVFTKEISSSAGQNTCTWDGKDNSNAATAPGMYFYKIATGGKLVVGKMIRQ